MSIESTIMDCYSIIDLQENLQNARKWLSNGHEWLSYDVRTISIKRRSTSMVQDKGIERDTDRHINLSPIKPIPVRLYKVIYRLKVLKVIHVILIA